MEPPEPVLYQPEARRGVQSPQHAPCMQIGRTVMLETCERLTSKPAQQPQPLPRLPMVGRGHDRECKLKRYQRRQVNEQAAVQQVVESDVCGPQLERACGRHSDQAI